MKEREVVVPLPEGIVVPEGVTVHFKRDPDDAEHPYGVVLNAFGCWSSARFEARAVEEHTPYFVLCMNATLESFAADARLIADSLSSPST